MTNSSDKGTTRKKEPVKNESKLMQTAVATILATSMFVVEPVIDTFLAIRFALSSPICEQSTYETRNDLKTMMRVYKKDSGDWIQYKTTRLYTGYTFMVDGDKVFLLNGDNKIIDMVPKTKHTSAYNYAMRVCGWGNTGDCNVSIRTTFVYEKMSFGLIKPSTESRLIHRK